VNPINTLFSEPYETSLELPLVTVRNTTGFLKRIQQIIMILLRPLLDACQYVYHAFANFKKSRSFQIFLSKNSENYLHYDLKTLPWANKKESKGLFLFVHGLFGNTYTFGSYISECHKNYPDWDVVAPRVYQRGICSLEQATLPLLNILKDYLNRFPTSPVYLIGTSNGARILSKIETLLSEEDLSSRKTRIISVAGVHLGTKVVDTLVNFQSIRKHFFHELSEELTFNSPFAQQLLKELQEKQTVWKEHGVDIKHLFIASLYDECVLPQSSCLPILKQGQTHYKIFPDHNHLSVVHGAKKTVFNWLKEN
jgi:predicted alpha/beta-fold hydrolase